MLKTIKDTSPSYFDSAVNSYLEDGWKILKVSVGGTQNSTTLVAFLIKDHADV